MFSAISVKLIQTNILYNYYCRILVAILKEIRLIILHIIHRQKKRTNNV